MVLEKCAPASSPSGPSFEREEWILVSNRRIKTRQTFPERETILVTSKIIPGAASPAGFLVRRQGGRGRRRRVKEKDGRLIISVELQALRCDPVLKQTDIYLLLFPRGKIEKT